MKRKTRIVEEVRDTRKMRAKSQNDLVVVMMLDAAKESGSSAAKRQTNRDVGASGTAIDEIEKVLAFLA